MMFLHTLRRTMTMNNVFYLIFISVLFVLILVNAMMDIRIKDEREKDALLKSLHFSVAVVLYFAMFEILFGLEQSNFNVPVSYIIILFIGGSLIRLLVYPLYLQYDSLEVPFIRNCTNEKKAKIYGWLLNIDIILMAICLFANSFLTKSKSHDKGIHIGTVGVITCLLIEFFILKATPRKRLSTEKKRKDLKLRVIIFLITILITVIFTIIGFIVKSRNLL